VRDGDHRYLACDSNKDCPTDQHRCQDTQFCALTTAQIADLSASHFKKWIEANPDDDDTSKLMTEVWVNSEAYDSALAYWTEQHKAHPNDTNIMGRIAGISQTKGDWRESVIWYRKVAEGSTDPTAKVAAYTYIGRVARAKLANRSLSPGDSIELADDGIGALQKAAQLDPKNAATFGLMGALWSLRSTVQGGSYASGIDRATSQDLLAVQRVLFTEAKKAEEGLPAQGSGSAGSAGSAAPAPTPPAPTPPTPKTGG